MKLISLAISDSGYNSALNLAKVHSLPVEAYLASELEDLLDSRRHAAPNGQSAVLSPVAQQQVRRAMPDALEQVLAVCEQVYRSRIVPQTPDEARNLFLDALHMVAKKTVNGTLVGVEQTTIRDKCTRQLGINTPTFIGLLSNPKILSDALCAKFPAFAIDINQRFKDWLP